MITIETMYYIDNWTKKYNKKKVKLVKLLKNDSWQNIFTKEYFVNIEIFLEKLIKKKINIFPYPSLLFEPFNIVDLNKVRVVIIGQEPYTKTIDNIPIATGIPFSIPKGVTIPSSLKNIFVNLIKFHHLNEFPDNGDLSNWVTQGCLMFNCSFTIDKDKKYDHSKYWKLFVNHIIHYLSKYHHNLVFILLGEKAVKKGKLIDTNKHKIFTSTHPSSRVVESKLNNLPYFMDIDLFGLTNKYLKKYWNYTIKWSSVNENEKA